MGLVEWLTLKLDFSEDPSPTSNSVYDVPQIILFISINVGAERGACVSRLCKGRCVRLCFYCGLGCHVNEEDDDRWSTVSNKYNGNGMI